MAGYDEEIRVAIIANADGMEAGTAQAATAVEGFEARVKASTTAAAAAYAESQQVWATATASAAEIVANSQAASTAQIVASYDAMNAARDASLANAQAYLTALVASQQAAVEAENYAAAGAASSTFEQVSAEQAAAESAYQNAAAQLEAAGAIDINATATDADTAAEIENAGAKTINRGATIGLTEAVAGLARGNIGMAAYGMARMGVASRALTFLMTPLGLAIAGTTAAIAGLGIAAIVGADQSQELDGALLSTSDAAGLTTDQLQAMSTQLAAGDTTVGEARDAILALARGGEYSGQAFRDAAQAVVDFASLTGQNTAQAAKYVETLANATTQQLIKANAQYHFLSLAQFTNIENLRKEGKATEATDAIVQAFYAHMHSGAQQAVADEGYIARGWEAIKRGVSDAINALEEWGRKATTADKIAELQRALVQQREADPFDTSGAQKMIEAEITKLKALERQKEATAKAAATADDATQSSIVAKYGSGAKHAHAAHTVSMHIPRESTSYADRILAEDGRILNGLQRDAEQRARIAQQVNSIEENAARNHASAMLQIHLDQLRTQEAQGKITHAQELADEKKLYDQEYAAQLAEYQKELALEKDKPVEIARINAEIEAMQDAHAQKMAAAAEKSAQQQAKAFQSALQPITSAFTTSINGIIQGTQTMQMAIGRMLDSILLKYLDLAIKSSVQWVASEAQKTMATETGVMIRTGAEEAGAARTLAIKILNAGKTIAIDAAEAAAGAFKAMVGIPVIGPALAVAAGAAAFMEVKNLAHFDKGAWNIPHDGVAMLHAGETILPPPHSAVLRDALNGGGGVKGGGETHVHLHGHSAGGLFTAHVDDLVAAIKGAHRTGAFA